nr:hypothetical protein [Halomicroarcula sp. YJ-61-S]
MSGIDDGTVRTVRYAWDRWNQPAYEERLKQSYHVLADAGWRT